MVFPQGLAHDRGAVTHPPVIWLLCDGKPGHENQSLGLAEAIGRRVRCEIHRIDLSAAAGMLGRHFLAMQANRDLPRPDLILGAGHSTHASLWWLARKTGAKSVVLMRPSLPLGCFDLCIAPAHDFLEGFERTGLVLTRGALNRVKDAAGEKSGKLILIGGPSKTHGWDGDSLLEMLALATDRGGWELTDSRRTPDGFLDQVRARLPGVTAFSHEETPPDWVPEKLGQAKEVWVTEDSVSMIYEALTSGARVGLLPLPRLKSGARILNGIDRLLAEKFLTPFAGWREFQRISSPPEILREADRCAEIVIAHLTSMNQHQS